MTSGALKLGGGRGRLSFCEVLSNINMYWHFAKCIVLKFFDFVCVCVCVRACVVYACVCMHVCVHVCVWGSKYREKKEFWVRKVECKKGSAFIIDY